MAWNTVPTFVAGNVLTAAQMNDLGGNLTSLRGDWEQSRRTSGNFTLNNTSWADLDTGLDLTLAASSGDVVEVSLSALSGSEAVDVYLDAVTVVSGSATNSFATGGTLPGATHQGAMAWRGSSNTVVSIGGSLWYELAAGDITSNTVVLRLRYRTSTATNKTVFANTPTPFVFTARNHGPVQI